MYLAAKLFRKGADNVVVCAFHLERKSADDSFIYHLRRIELGESAKRIFFLSIPFFLSPFIRSRPANPCDHPNDNFLMTCKLACGYGCTGDAALRSLTTTRNLSSEMKVRPFEPPCSSVDGDITGPKNEKLLAGGVGQAIGYCDGKIAPRTHLECLQRRRTIELSMAVQSKSLNTRPPVLTGIGVASRAPVSVASGLGSNSP